MKKLILFARGMAEKWAEKMFAGEIAASPLCDKNRKGPCELCDYAAICRRDVTRTPGNIRFMDSMSFQELLDRINRPENERKEHP